MCLERYMIEDEPSESSDGEFPLPLEVILERTTFHFVFVYKLIPISLHISIELNSKCRDMTMGFYGSFLSSNQEV